MVLEEQRYLHEDLERLEQGIVDRIGDEPKQIRDRLNRDHEISQLLDQIQVQSQNLLHIYRDSTEARETELSSITGPDAFDTFYSQLKDIRDHHAKYPNEVAQNSELRYRKRAADVGVSLVESLFSGEEAYGRYFDLYASHERFLNLPGVKRHSYIQYLELFDNFASGMGGIKRADKVTDQYFQYVRELAGYLEGFMSRIKPLENVKKQVAEFEREFEEAWQKDEIDTWKSETAANADVQTSTPDAIYCADCEKEFKNANVHKAHLTGKKHIKAAEARAARQAEASEEKSTAAQNGGMSATRLKEKAVAQKEFIIKKFTTAMSTERSDTRNNVERKQGMTERERRQELESIFNEEAAYAERQTGDDEEGDEEGDDDDRIYNPLKLPLAWDGKPIPFWLYRLHGLGQEHPCEICGNFVYMGRRAFDKHFNEARHVYGLRCLGITNTTLFRDITDIGEAMKLWEKIQREEKKQKDDSAMVQMEDGEGNVMPEKVYYDLQKQGLL